MVVQRAFSSFPSGCPGAALFLLRLTAGGIAGLQASIILAGAKGAAGGDVLISTLAMILASALMVGFMTPVAAMLVTVGGVFVMLDADIARTLTLFESWTARAEFIVLCAVLTCLGPGSFSLDARLYGRREIQVSDDGV
jgi:hypothetical protein